MTQTRDMKLGHQARDFVSAEVALKREDEGKMLRLSFPASSEAPVERFYGTEVLKHDARSIRMDRLNSGAAPLLFNHNWDDPIGMIDGARIENRRLVVDAHLFDTPRAREVAAMIEGGMRNVSIGYQIHEMVEDTKARTYTATDWGVYEVSFATVPADPSVGYGRGQDAATETTVRVLASPSGEATQTTVEITPSQPAAPAAHHRSIAVSDHQQAAAGANADTAVNDGAHATRAATVPALPAGTTGNRALELEQQRRRGIENLCRANKIDEAIRDHWVGSGLSIEAITEDLLQIVQKRADATQRTAELGMSAGETRRYSLMSAIRAVADKNWSNAGFELECSREIAKRLNTVTDPNKFYVPFEVQTRNVQVPAQAAGRRDLTAASLGGGGALVATENMSFIELLRNRSVAYRMGARRLSGLVGNVTVPRQTAAATAYWLANEGTQITESQQSFGQMALAPKTVGAYTEISRQLMLQSSPDAEGIVTGDLAAVSALAVDVGVLRGSGSGGEPTGIVNTGGIGSVTGTSLGYAGVLEFQTDVAAANIMPARGGYVTTPAVAALMMQRARFSNTDTPLWQGNLWDGQMAGFAAMSSNQMSSATMLFGDWDQVVVAEWGVLQVEVNPYANFQAGIIGVRAMVTVDVGLRYAAAFSLASSIT